MTRVLADDVWRNQAATARLLADVRAFRLPRRTRAKLAAARALNTAIYRLAVQGRFRSAMTLIRVAAAPVRFRVRLRRAVTLATRWVLRRQDGEPHRA